MMASASADPVLSAHPVLRFWVSWVMVLLASMVLLVVIFFSCAPFGACHLQLQVFFFFDLSAVDADALDELVTKI